MLTLRPYQQEAMEAVKSKWASGVNRLLVKLPTGTGKTPLFSSVPDAMELGSKRMMVLVHRDELAKQAKDKLLQWNPGKTVGIEMAESHANGSQLVVASVQTVGKVKSKRIEKFLPNDFGALVIDEAHHATAATYRRIIEYFVPEDSNTLLMGVTATVNRSDGTPLGEVFDEIAYDMPILTAIKGGWLVDLCGTRMKSKINLTGLHTSYGEFITGELSGAVNTVERNDAVARFWLEEGEQRQTIVFAVDVAHSKDLAEALKRYGVAAEAVWGDDPDRAEKLAFHREGKLKVLVNCQLLTEGYDDWRVGCIVMARPVLSELLYVQMVGRGTRIQNGIYNLYDAREKGQEILKESCLILDVVDNTTRHSLVTLSSLYGFDKEVDFKKRKVSEISDQVAAIKKKRPHVDMANATDINKLDTYAEQIDLWAINYPPEVIQFSQYKWRRAKSGIYTLPLLDGEFVGVAQDVLGKFHVLGTVNGTDVNFVELSLESALKEADRKVQILGGKAVESIVRREAKWHGNAPTEKQLLMCRAFRIPVYPTDNRGTLSEKISIAMERSKEYVRRTTGVRI